MPRGHVAFKLAPPMLQSLNIYLMNKSISIQKTEGALGHTASQRPTKDANVHILMLNGECIPPLPISLPSLRAIVIRQIVNKNRNSQSFGIKVG